MPAERVFADTNLFLRYLTNDVPDQAEAVEILMDQAAAGKLTLVVNSLVIAELVWTLESYYELPRPAIREKILAILNTPGLEIPDPSLILQAVAWYADRNVDFIDAYNASWCQRQALEKVYTFDRRHFARLGVTPMVPGEPAA